LDFGKITAGPVDDQPSTADVQTQLELTELENAWLQNQALAQDIELRQVYSNRIFCLIVCWLACVFGLLLLQGFGGPGTAWDVQAGWFRVRSEGHAVFLLSDAVLLATIGGTTGSVIGIFIIVVTYLFPKRDGISAMGREKAPKN